MNEWDILVDGLVAYGFVIAGYAFLLEVFGSSAAKSLARTAKTLAPLAVTARLHYLPRKAHRNAH